MQFLFAQCVGVPKKKIGHDQNGTTLEPVGKIFMCHRQGSSSEAMNVSGPNRRSCSGWTSEYAVDDLIPNITLAEWLQCCQIRLH